MRKTISMKKLVSLSLALLLMLSTLAILPVSAETPKTWADSTGDTYYIGSAEDMALFAANGGTDGYYDGKTVELTNDIDMTGKSWSRLTYFGGDFNGNGFTITGLTLSNSGKNEGAFVRLFDGKIRNVKFVACSVTSTNTDETETRLTQGVGCLIGQATGSGTATFNNVSVEGTVTASSASNVGGFVGYAKIPVTFLNCKNNVTVKGKGNVGGFVGQSTATVSFEECTNNGGVTNGLLPNTAGFIGKAAGAVSFDNCHCAAVTIAGKYSYNKDDSLGTTSSGGFVGLAEQSVTITNSTTAADLTGREDIGGFVGLSMQNVTIQNSYSAATTIQISLVNRVGGFIGTVCNVATIDSCVSDVSLKGYSAIGGFVGAVGDEASIEIAESSLIGSVTCNGSFSGGFIGRGSGVVTLNKCVNMGAISDQVYMAGLIVMHRTDVFDNTTLSDTRKPAINVIDCYTVLGSVNLAIRKHNGTGFVYETEDVTVIDLATFDFADTAELFPNWVEKDGKMIPAKAAKTMEYCPITADVLYQVKGDTVRLITAVNDLRFVEAGFGVQITRTPLNSSDPAETSAVIPVTSTTVYTSIYGKLDANEEERSLTAADIWGADYEGYYIVAIVIDGVDYANYAHTFSVTSQVTMADSTVLSTAATVITPDFN